MDYSKFTEACGKVVMDRIQVVFDDENRLAAYLNREAFKDNRERMAAMFADAMNGLMNFGILSANTHDAEAHNNPNLEEKEVATRQLETEEVLTATTQGWWLA